jgi:hypothetical protein
MLWHKYLIFGQFGSCLPARVRPDLCTFVLEGVTGYPTCYKVIADVCFMCHISCLTGPYWPNHSICPSRLGQKLCIDSSLISSPHTMVPAEYNHVLVLARKILGCPFGVWLVASSYAILYQGNDMSQITQKSSTSRVKQDYHVIRGKQMTWCLPQSQSEEQNLGPYLCCLGVW